MISFIKLTQARVTWKEGSFNWGIAPIQLGQFLDWWLRWESPVYCRKGYPVVSGLGLYKEASWASQWSKLVNSFLFLPPGSWVEFLPWLPLVNLFPQVAFGQYFTKQCQSKLELRVKGKHCYTKKTTECMTLLEPNENRMEVFSCEEVWNVCATL